MVALCPKCYTVWDNEIIIDDNGEEVNKPQLKAKGVSLKQNKNITQEDYLNIVNNGGSITGINTTGRLSHAILRFNTPSIFFLDLFKK